MNVNELKFNEQGLIPAIVQDAASKDVVMLAYMNAASIEKTLETGYATFYSRSRQELWQKGATSGHLQQVVSMGYDCDKDAILIIANQTGVACHTGSWSCFENVETASGSTIKQLYNTIQERQKNPVDGSYTTYLFSKGIDKILKKVGEESAEIIIAAKNPDKQELIYEISDMVYHTLVLMAERGVTVEEINEALRGRMEGKY